MPSICSTTWTVYPPARPSLPRLSCSPSASPLATLASRCCVLPWRVARSAGVWLSLLLAGVYLAITVLFGAFLAQVRILNPVEFAERSAALADRPVVNGMIMFKRELGEAALDFVLVCLAYLGAFVLHYGFPNPAAPGPDPYKEMPTLLSASLTYVLAATMCVLLVFHAYRGMWRYLG